MQIYIGKKREKDINDYLIVIPSHIEKLNLPFDKMMKFSFKTKLDSNYDEKFTFQIKNKKTEFFSIFKYTSEYIVKNIILNLEINLVGIYLYDIQTKVAYLSRYLTKEDAFELTKELLYKPITKAISPYNISNDEIRYYLMNIKNLIELKEETRYIYNKNIIELSDDLYYDLNNSTFKFDVTEEPELIEKYEILFDKNFVKFTNKKFIEILNKKIEKYKETKKLNKNEWTLIMICPLLISLQKTILI